jgi:secreted PhoX family phosphatase
LAVNCAEAQRARAGFQAHETVAQQLGSESVLDSLGDNVSVPPGYRVQVFFPWGTPIDGASPIFDEINAVNSAEDQPMQAGKHHDDLYYFPLTAPSIQNAVSIASTTKTTRKRIYTQTAPPSTMMAAARWWTRYARISTRTASL